MNKNNSLRTEVQAQGHSIVYNLGGSDLRLHAIGIFDILSEFILWRWDARLAEGIERVMPKF